MGALLLRSQCYHGMGMSEQALADLMTACRLQPTNGQAVFFRSIVLHGMGALTQALMGYLFLLRLDPGNAAAFQAECAKHLMCVCAPLRRRARPASRRIVSAQLAAGHPFRRLQHRL